MQTERLTEIQRSENVVLWFDSLIAPKHLEATDNAVTCRIGFNRVVTVDGIARVVSSTIEVDATSITEALGDAKLQYEFLASDVLDPV